MGSEARARLGLIGLGSITLLTFNQLFGQEEFAGPALLAMMAAIGVTLICRRLGLWPSTTLAVSAIVMIWYLALIFHAPATFYGLPTLTAVQRLGTSISRAYEHSHVDFAPVPLRPGYAILSVAAMWVLVSLGEVATFRWRRPLLASIPAVALFSFLLVVGTGEGATINVIVFLAALLTYWALESDHRLRSWGRWVPVWKSQKAQEPASITGALARRMGASCVAAALVLPVFLPALEEGLISWRSKSGEGVAGEGAGGPGAPGGRIDPLVSLVPELIQQSEEELFRVTADRAEYWRLLTLSDFDGEKWTDGSNLTVAVPPSGALSITAGVPNPGRSLDQRFEVTGLEGQPLPVAGVPLTIIPLQGATGLQIDPSTADVKLEEGLEEGFVYDVQATVPDTSFRKLREAEVVEVEPGDPLVQVGPVDGPGLSPAVKQLLQLWTRGAKTDFERLIAIQSRLRGFDYDVQLNKPTSSDYLQEFLLETRVGYCQQFATAFTLLARELGLPTRVSVGFLPGRTSIEAPNTYTVTGNDTHAWPEVWFEGFGWVRFEPTPRDEAPEPVYTLARIASDPATITGAEAPLTEGRGGKRGLGEVQGNTGPNRAAQNPNNVGDGSVAEEGRINSDWQKTFGRVALVLLVLLLLFVALVPLLKRANIERRYRRATDTRAKAAAAFAEFQQEAAELASGRARGESAAAYARRLARETLLPRSSVIRLASIYEAAEFAPVEPSPQVADEAKRLARQLRVSLWQQAGWWRRINRLWSPAGVAPRVSLPIKRIALQKILSLGRS
ncbi:MAG: DUF3488 and transglutaminase-like domain-containing protein [Actinomycetota bacterium]|nr:DUF3488 and transglutaminase-like domain-containing protein [Actinomycetota bacterium]